MKSQKTIFSGIQPSGELHIGHYFGAIKNWVTLQNEYRAIFCVVDEHAITVPQEPEKLRERTLDTAILYIACGIDPKKSTIFVQSHNPDHTQLGWILNTITPLGELERMTQFKDKAIKPALSAISGKVISGVMSPEEMRGNLTEHTEKVVREEIRKNIYAGLLNYPTLMAADILLYQTDAVPVGEDQKQHVELTRTLARKFNTRFGPTFKEPKELIQKSGARIMALDDPTKKMSKSSPNKDSYIGLLDTPDDIKRKIKIAVTDSGKEVHFDPEKKPAIANLISLYHLVSGLNIKEIEKKFNGKGYGDFKKELGDALAEHLTPIKKKYYELKRDKKLMEQILTKGTKDAKAISSKTLSDVKQKIGFL
ncbi:MAG: tryptophan--tRNA ligase [bacterium]|nr:tryptophan--tRNA ligase [bacterium]